MADTQRLYYAYTTDTVHKQTHQRECKEEHPPSKYTVNSLTSHKTKHPFLFPRVCACAGFGFRGRNWFVADGFFSLWLI